MAAFVDCTKYTKEQDAQDKALQNLAKKNEEQDKSIKALEDREIVHDNTLTGGGISKSDPLSVAVSTKPGNAVKTGEAAGGSGVFVKDLQPEVDALEKALSDTNNRLSGDLTNSIKDLNNRLNNLKAIEVALAQAKADGNYQRIKDLEAQLAAAKQAEDLANKNLADAIDALRQQGLTDDQIRQIIADSITKAGGTGRYVTGITVNQATGDVTYTYSDGTKVTGKLHEFQGVVVDNKTIGGNGTSEALRTKVSRASGNLLTTKDDGLYVGQAATYPNLYVDSVNGSDDNIGTREKPLRTIAEALSRNSVTTNRRIYLKCGHDYEITTSVSISNSNIVFLAYGDNYSDMVGVEYNSTDKLWYEWWIAKPLDRPRILFKQPKEYDENRKLAEPPLIKGGGGSVEFYGININVHQEAPKEGFRYSTGYSVILQQTAEIKFHGCVFSYDKPFKVLERPAFIGPVNTDGGCGIVLARCDYEGTPDLPLLNTGIFPYTLLINNPYTISPGFGVEVLSGNLLAFANANKEKIYIGADTYTNGRSFKAFTTNVGEP